MFLVSVAPVSPDKLREAVAAFGPVLCQSYGQAETPFFVAFLSREDHRRAVADVGSAHLLQSCGRATIFNLVEIMSDDGRLLGPREVGEVVARGNLVTNGYYRNPAASAAVSEHGWHHTRDIGFKDEGGYLYIVDRKKDMIITGGFNVYSVEVEKVLLAHAAVQDCAIIGVPDEKWGEAVTGVVELKAGQDATPEDLMRHCRAALGGVKAPKCIEIQDHLPRSPVGKVLKRAIRDEYWSGRSRAN